MEQTQPDTDGPLSQHNLRFSPRGLMTRYAAIRTRLFYARMAAAAGLTLVLSLIPVLNLIGPTIAFLWGAWSLALQYLECSASVVTAMCPGNPGL